MQNSAVAVQDDSFSRLRGILLDGVTSPESKRAYGRGIDRFLRWCDTEQPQTGFSKATVQRYRAHLVDAGLAAPTINQHLSAIRRLAVEASDNGLLAAELAGGISRVKGIRQEGSRIGNWLTKTQAEHLINTPDTTTLKGKRDRALLALLIGCGLRRQETARLTIEHIQQRDGRWVIVDMLGKGGRVRSIPAPAFAKAAIDAWTAAAGVNQGHLFRPINKGGNLSGTSMTSQSIFETVKAYAAKAGVPCIAPHDLRRSFARLSHKGHAPLEQIQLSLGHASILTTERYIGVSQDLADAPCDRLGLRLS